VDEVGRGPLAGPLAVGAVCIDKKRRRYLRGVKDSKKLTPLAREVWYAKFRNLEKMGIIRYKVAFVSEAMIDRNGLSSALMKAVGSCLRRLEVGPDTKIILDGSLYAPASYTQQKTLVRGDEKRSVIAAASIIAKVLRDRKMKCLGKRFPLYGFEKHKGYGTKAHYLALQIHGPSDFHRRSFLKGRR